MLKPSSVSPRLIAGLVALLALALVSGCSQKRVRDDPLPIIHTGVGATILYPNQTGPGMPQDPRVRGGYQRPGQAAPPGQVPYRGYPSQVTGQAQSPAAGNAASRVPQESQVGGGVTFIGGSQQEADGERVTRRETPLAIRVLRAPLMLLAAPFVWVYQAVSADDEEAPSSTAQPSNTSAPRSYSDLQTARERAELEAMERELASRGGAAPPPVPTSASAPSPGATPLGRAPAPRVSIAPAPPAPRTASRRLSIAEELAALRGTPPAPTPGPAPAVGGSLAPPRGVADRVADRDRDGRPDQWSYRDGGRTVRELFDENADGAPDRTVHLDPASGERTRIEEDTDFDGRIDAWTEYRDGVLSRRRSDSDHDGRLDTWIFYQSGQMARAEHDRDGDGFRDRVEHYQDGRLDRQEEDANGDGHPDRVTLYDAEERVLQVDEDRDGDGLVDVRSFYEAGRLSRREMLAEDVATPMEQRNLSSATWDDGEPSEGSR
jgi:hypothetical protein